MDQRESLTSQAEINKVWGNFWREQDELNPRTIFKHRLFVEGAPVLAKYVPATTTSILQVGAGSGRYAMHLAKTFPQARVVATDISMEAVKYMERMIPALNINNCEAVVAEVEKLPFTDNSFEVILCDVLLQHLPKVDQAMIEMKRVLKPGGRLIIANVNYWNFHTLYKWTLRLLGRPYPYGYERSYSHRLSRRLLKDYGFKVLAQDGFYPAYGIYRLKNIHPIFGWLGKVLNRLTKILDKISRRSLSYYFGMEVVVVGEKGL